MTNKMDNFTKQNDGKYLMTIQKDNNYLSELKDENGKPIKFELPNGILDKQITGCGGTTLSLMDKHPYIICSPRNKLLENKHEQFNNTFLFNCNILEKSLKYYINHSELPKILVTYDSLYKVIRNIDDISKYRVLVDEFQCLLNDSTFKCETELHFLSTLKNCPYVTFLSATPVLDDYLKEIDYFKDMPYYRLNWLGAEIAQIKRIKTNSPISIAKRIIELYKTHNGIRINNDDIVSKECVIYLNSVTNIVNLIKDTKLTSDEVNIIVANNEDNDKLIKCLGKQYHNGKIPLKGEKHKMFTMCTSTAYFGVDMYSDNALTFVISDCNNINTSVDIATELQQIAGRQRLESNPFRKLIYFIYNTNRETLSENEFNELLNDKCNKSNRIIEYYNNCNDKIIKDNKIDDVNKLIKLDKFKDNFVYVDNGIIYKIN
jgi:hypothetical protein